MPEQKPMTAEAVRADDHEVARQRYIMLLMDILESYGASTKDVNRQLKELQAQPQAKIGQGLIDIIKALCDCTAVQIILECLCKLFTK